MHLVGGLHECRKSILNPEQLVDGIVVEAEPLPFQQHAHHAQRDALGHQVAGIQVVVVIGLQHPVRLLHARHEPVSGSQALVIQLRVVSLDAELLQHADGTHHLRAVQADLEKRAGEKQVDRKWLEIPGMGQEQATEHNRHAQQ